MRLLIAGLHETQQVLQNTAGIPVRPELHLTPGKSRRKRQAANCHGDHAKVHPRGQAGILERFRNPWQKIVVGNVDCVRRFQATQLQKQNPPTLFRRRHIRHQVTIVAQARTTHGALIDKTMHVQIGSGVGHQGDTAVAFPGQQGHGQFDRLSQVGEHCRFVPHGGSARKNNERLSGGFKFPQCMVGNKSIEEITVAGRRLQHRGDFFRGQVNVLVGARTNHRQIVSASHGRLGKTFQLQTQAGSVTVKMRPQLKLETIALPSRTRAFICLFPGKKLFSGRNRKGRAHAVASIGHGNTPQISPAPLLLDQNSLLLERSQRPPQGRTAYLEQSGQLALGPQPHSCLCGRLGKRPDQGFDDDLAGDSGHGFSIVAGCGKIYPAVATITMARDYAGKLNQRCPIASRHHRARCKDPHYGTNTLEHRSTCWKRGMSCEVSLGPMMRGQSKAKTLSTGTLISLAKAGMLLPLRFLTGCAI